MITKARERTTRRPAATILILVLVLALWAIFWDQQYSAMAASRNSDPSVRGSSLVASAICQPVLPPDYVEAIDALDNDQPANTPTPSPCLSSAGGSGSGCDGQGNYGYGFNVQNSCAEPVAGQVTVLFEVSDSYGGPWMIWDQRPAYAYTFQPGMSHLEEDIYEGPIPYPYNLFRFELSVSYAGGTYYDATGPVQICGPRPPTPTSTPLPTATSTPQPCGISFTDVSPSDYFYAAIRCLYCAGAISGYDDNTFRPYNDTTRAQLAKMTVLSKGWLIDTIGGPHFTDVPPSHTFYGFVETAYNRGIISGYEDGTFRPGNPATRGQTCKIVANAAGFTEPVSGQIYADVREDNPYYAQIMRLTNRGVVSGYPCGGQGEPCDGDNRPYFRWGNNVIRGQAAKIVANAIFDGCVAPGRSK